MFFYSIKLELSYETKIITLYEKTQTLNRILENRNVEHIIFYFIPDLTNVRFLCLISGDAKWFGFFLFQLWLNWQISAYLSEYNNSIYHHLFCRFEGYRDIYWSSKYTYITFLLSLQHLVLLCGSISAQLYAM